MTFNYARAAATAKRLIANFGQTATLTKPGAVTGPEYAPTGYGAGTDYTIKAVDLNQMERDGATLTGQTRRTLYISTEGLSGVEVNKADTITIGGRKHEVAEARPLAPGGVNVMWEADLANG